MACYVQRQLSKNSFKSRLSYTFLKHSIMHVSGYSLKDLFKKHVKEQLSDNEIKIL